MMLDRILEFVVGLTIGFVVIVAATMDQQRRNEP